MLVSVKRGEVGHEKGIGLDVGRIGCALRGTVVGVRRFMDNRFMDRRFSISGRPHRNGGANHLNMVAISMNWPEAIVCCVAILTAGFVVLMIYFAEKDEGEK